MDTTYQWINIEQIGVEGRGWTDRESPYDRLPLHAKEKICNFSQAVWDLSHSSTGMCVTFWTDSTEIRIRRELALPQLNEYNFNSCAFSGFDLYGETAKGIWRWIGTTPYRDSENSEYALAVNMAPGFRKYRIYLPLRNQLLRAEIGLQKGAKFEAVQPRPLSESMVFYGSSIVHGAYVTHAGLSHPSRLGRALDRPVINLGFSGMAKMETGMAEVLGELACSLYVIDALPNMYPALVRQNAVPFLKRLRELKPQTPILLMEEPDRANDWVYPDLRKHTQRNRAELRKAFRQVLTDGMNDLYYLRGYGLTGLDGENSVDGIHPCDGAVEQMYRKILPVIRKIFKK